MRTGYKRSFWGYDPAGVDGLQEQMDREYKSILVQLRKQLSDEVRQLELIRVEIEKLKQEVDVYRKKENEISRLLLKAHMEASEKALAALGESDQKEKAAAERVMLRRAELVNLKATMEKARSEIASMVSQYMPVNDKAEGE